MSVRKSVKIFSAILILLFLLFSILLILETYFRITKKYPVAAIEYSPTEIWHWHKNLNSNTWDEESGNFVQHTDKFGFRNYGKNYLKEENSVRILIIGDSYTAGLTHADDRIFTSLLEKKLNALHFTDKKIEVFNMASPAWGTEQQFLCLKNFGLPAKPDYVIMMTCPNDIRETYCKRFAYLENGEVKFNPVPFNKSEIVKWNLSCYSNFYQYLQANVFQTSYGSFDMLMGKFHFAFGKENTTSWDRPLFLKTTFPELDEAWNLYFKIVDDSRKLCDENNIRFAVSTTPFVLEFDETTINDTNMEAGIVTKKIAGHCATQNIPYFNLYVTFQNNANPVSLFRPTDQHFNTSGHEVVAEKLSEYFRTAIR